MQAQAERTVGLLSPDGSWEAWFDSKLSTEALHDDVFSQGPVHQQVVRPGVLMCWSGGQSMWDNCMVNHSASMLAGQQVRGTVMFTCAPTMQEDLVDLVKGGSRALRGEAKATAVQAMEKPGENPCLQPGQVLQGNQMGQVAQAGHVTTRATHTPHAGGASRRVRSRPLGDARYAMAAPLSSQDGLDGGDDAGDCLPATDPTGAHTRDDSPHRHKPAHHNTDLAPTDLAPADFAAQICPRTPDLHSEAPWALASTPLAPVPPDFPPWHDLPSGVLSMVAAALPDTASALLPLCATCKSWRSALVHDHVILRRTWFNVDLSALSKPSTPPSLAPSAACPTPASSSAAARGGTSAIPQPSSLSSTACASGSQAHIAARAPARHEDPTAAEPDGAFVDSRHRFLLGLCAAGNLRLSSEAPAPRAQATPCPQAAAAKALLRHVPLLLREAVKQRNVTAIGLLAQLHEVAGNEAEANRWWLKGAKGGDLEAMFKAGFAMYERCAGVEPDASSAYTWLSKALRKTLSVSSLSQVQVDAGKPSEAVSTQRQQQAVGASVPPHSKAMLHRLMTTGLQHEQAAVLLALVARAAVVLGYLLFDGEAMKADPSEACRMFKLAASCGSREGSRVLGWMWNTGQY